MARSSIDYTPYQIKKAFPKDELPIPIFEDQPGFVELYWKAWESAWSHVLDRPDMPQHTYMDEAMTPHRIWIWDTCFMSLFCRYAPHAYPGVESLNNFYYIIHDRQKTPVKIHFGDNPPLFAWVEWEYYQLTGDKARLNWVLKEKQYLQKHFYFIETLGTKFYHNASLLVRPDVKKKTYGYRSKGNTAGMDNTPRGRNSWNATLWNPRGQIAFNKILFIDLISQQALSAWAIVQIAKVCDSPEIEHEFEQKYTQLKQIINDFYWDEEDGIYYDIKDLSDDKLRSLQASKSPDRFHKVPTIASFWPMLAQVPTPEQASRLIQLIQDPNKFGGPIPFPSVARDDPDYDPRGRYWRGGIWLPTSYMCIKGLEKNGFYGLADQTAEDFLKDMLTTYTDFDPHTIWEAYSPSEAKPSTTKTNNGWAEPDFCGWSALGPISIFIENIIGIHKINAQNQEIFWRIHYSGKHGIQNLHIGSNIVSLIYYPSGELDIKCSSPIKIHLTDEKGIIQNTIEAIPSQTKYQMH